MFFLKHLKDNCSWYTFHCKIPEGRIFLSTGILYLLYTVDSEQDKGHYITLVMMEKKGKD